MLSVVYWLWKDSRPYREYDGSLRPRVYGVERVNSQLPMLRRHMTVPYRVVCVTDDTKGLDPSIESFPMPVSDESHSSGDTRFPTCYRLLWTFSSQARALGDRILKLDVDSVIVSSMSPVVDREEPLVVARHPTNGVISGCVYLMDSGSHADVWDRFDMSTSPIEMGQENPMLRPPGTDQAWLNHVLPADTPSFGPEVRLPTLTDSVDTPDASIVCFSGPLKPWMAETIRRNPWIPQHYSGVP